MPEPAPDYDRIGIGYDETRRADPRIAADLARHLGTRPDGRYLDLACGTGNYTASLAGRGLRVVGADRSRLMLERARAKSAAIPWCQADVAALPFRAGTFDGALCTLALHHFPDPRAALAEARRVLVPGARLVIFTTFPEQMEGYWLVEYFPRMLARSIAQMPSAEALERTLRQAGLRLVRVEPWLVPPDPVDLFLYGGKHRPELYLHPAVRRGISSFALLADAGEVEAGLARLAADRASGRLAEIRARATSPRGDYAFVVAEAGSGA
jgi:ubiquinone/menaquinone biosynthesis C-methylase UbiE